jgi:hypothetical protein
MGWIGVGISALGAIREGQQNAAALRRNATLLGYKQTYDQQIADLEIGKLRSGYRRVIGRANFANAASGFDASSKSSIHAVDAIIKQAELDAASINLAAKMGTWASNAEIKGLGTAAQNVEAAGFFKAGSAIADQYAKQYSVGY